jgi:hypothetical protein
MDDFKSLFKKLVFHMNLYAWNFILQLLNHLYNHLILSDS